MSTKSPGSTTHFMSASRSSRCLRSMVKDSSWLARFEVDALEACKILFVGGDAAQYVADIELHYFISGTFAGVGHLQADGGRLFGVMTRGVMSRSEYSKVV